MGAKRSDALSTDDPAEQEKAPPKAGVAARQHRSDHRAREALEQEPPLGLPARIVRGADAEGQDRARPLRSNLNSHDPLEPFNRLLRTNAINMTAFMASAEPLCRFRIALWSLFWQA